MTLTALFLALLVVAILIWATRALLAAFGVPDPINTVIYVAVVVLSILWLLAQVGLSVPALVP
jgi:hypothetical protein